jgi:nucleotide-binding universal stress UspA family protein
VIQTILVAIDGSDLSEQVLATLNDLKLDSDTTIILCSVIPTQGYDVEVAADRPQTDQEDISYLQMQKLLQPFQAKVPCLSELEIVRGEPAEEIIRLANIYQTDLIVVGSRGLTGMNRILLGSVSSQVVADAHCSVLVVRPK